MARYKFHWEIKLDPNSDITEPFPHPTHCTKLVAIKAYIKHIGKLKLPKDAEVVRIVNGQIVHHKAKGRVKGI